MSGFTLTFGTGAPTNRRCGDCNLCCRLVPVESLGKAANEICRHQTQTGCGIYAKLGEMSDCRLWSCRWLSDHRAAELRRPDRSHYVVDIMPDFIGFRDNETGVTRDVPVMQVWCDPDFPEAWRDPPLMRLIERIANEDGAATLIRFANVRCIAVFAPCLTREGEWAERGGPVGDKTDWVNPFDKMRAQAGLRRAIPGDMATPFVWQPEE